MSSSTAYLDPFLSLSVTTFQVQLSSRHWITLCPFESRNLGMFGLFLLCFSSMAGPTQGMVTSLKRSLPSLDNNVWLLCKLCSNCSHWCVIWDTNFIPYHYCGFVVTTRCFTYLVLKVFAGLTMYSMYFLTLYLFLYSFWNYVPYSCYPFPLLMCSLHISTLHLCFCFCNTSVLFFCSV